ncbi:Beta-1,3-glucosyltransferase [Xenorhabdus bovienii str. kraussei Quebec]|uniref:Beta-1,3-glucosyltransferase n=1 Tax=Xenorhabdus bovienii str. kraussei Quebec TaxID=1398203 RepID=A0A077PK50_XENBV|nr:glycosyltransferase [Xenorhabdus bovienii]CDH20997.1 Beta-1,3-glucosyltransferase [Xenorhabdus bovienii str. kraussei Quebec]
MHNSPLVTVIIPSYNHEKFIESCILSIINQSYKNIELIVIDDGSKDNSHNLISNLNKKHNFIYIRKENSGLSNTLNIGIKKAKGKYIAFCASDDMYHPDKTKKQVHAMESNTESSFSYAKSYVIDDNDNVLINPTLSYNKNLSNQITFEDIFTFKKTIPVTGMYITEFLINVGCFDSKLTAEDYDINLRTINKTSFLFIDEHLYYYRSPLAIGSERKRLPMRVDVSESHLKTINKFSTHPLHRKALIQWNLRRFIMFSAYKKTKFYAIKGMLGSMVKCTNICYLKSIIKLLFFWK